MNANGKKIVYVNAYAVSRNWGGPEEGGWWYDSGEPLASIPVREEDDTVIELEKKRLMETIGWNRKGLGRYSVNGGEDFEIYVEEHPAKPWPERIPHYE